MSQGVMHHEAGNVAEFGGLRLQKLASSGSVEEKIASLNPRTCGPCDLAHVAQLAAGDLHAGT